MNKLSDFILANFKKRRVQFILLILTAILISISAIILETPFLRILPLFISLFVMLYHSEANRFAHLVGAANSVLYAMIYFSLELYASATSALFVSFPIGIITFLTWNRRSYKESVVFRKMPPVLLTITILGAVGLWLGLYLALDSLSSPFAILDNTAMVLNILVTLMTVLAFREYPYVSILHVMTALALKIQLVSSDITNLPFLIYTLYNTTCSVRTIINVRHICREQDINRSKGVTHEG